LTVATSGTANIRAVPAKWPPRPRRYLPYTGASLAEEDEEDEEEDAAVLRGLPPR
jgi:hypothetical protein